MKWLEMRRVTTLALAVAALAALAAAAQDPKDSTRAELMRQKLEYSKRILDGLTREDFPLISTNALTLKALDLAAQDEVLGPGKRLRYMEYAREFRNLAETLAERADAKNLDGATLAYLRLTANCVDCHKAIGDRAR